VRFKFSRAFLLFQKKERNVANCNGITISASKEGSSFKIFCSKYYLVLDSRLDEEILSSVVLQVMVYFNIQYSVVYISLLIATFIWKVQLTIAN
jgi:hypothetical protein